jgi:hypothetical protein
MTHPLQDLLIQHYRQARRAWAANRGVREAATLLGMTERAYCDQFITQWRPVVWTGTSTDHGWLDYDRAFREAAP